MKPYRWPTLREFGAQMLEVLRAYAPDVEQCEACGYPVIEGCCCSRCGANRENFSEYHTEREAREVREARG